MLRLLTFVLLLATAATDARALQLFPPFGPKYDAEISTVVPVGFSEDHYPGMFHPFSNPGFDRSLGTLIAASLTINGIVTADIHYRSNDGTYPDTVPLTVNTRLDGPGFSGFSSGVGGFATLVSPGVYHVSQTTNGSGGTIFGSENLLGIATPSPSGPYGIDAGVIPGYYCCQTYSGDQNSFSGNVTLTYYYNQPAQIPEPASAALLGIGLLNILRRRQRQLSI